MMPVDLPPPSAPIESVVRARPRDLRDLRMVLALTGDVWSHAMRNGEIDVRLSGDAIRALEGAGVPLEVLIPDVHAMIEAQAAARAQRRAEGGLAGEDWWADVKDLAAIEAKLDEWVAQHPDLVSPVLVGESLEGRPIRGVRLSAQPPGADIPAFLFDGCQHAREWATPMAVMLIGQQLIDGAAGDATIQAILEQGEIILVPVVNPDGYHFSWVDTRLWRKNRRPNAGGSFGVDLNRNWGWEWGGEGSSGNPDSETYRGPAPFSEPETQALRDFILQHGRIIGNIDFHSYSQLVMWPWGWTSALCSDQPLFETVGAAMVDAIESTHGRVYVSGPIYTTIYPASGGSVDWCYGGAGVYATTIEVRDTGSYGFLIPPEEVRPCAEENAAAALQMVQTMLVPALLTPDPEWPSLLSAGETSDITLHAAPLASSFAGPPLLHWRVGTSAPFAAEPMEPLGEQRFRGVLPAAPCGATVQAYVEWPGVPSTALLPAEGSSAPLAFAVNGIVPILVDDLESGAGWAAGAPGDTATSGVWALVDPNGTTAQPENDHSGVGTRCWVTGQGPVGGQAGAADVDNGITSLTSPALDGSDPDAIVRYWRWYSNNLGAAPNSDSMLVQYSTDGVLWSLLEEVSSNAGAWVQASFRIGDFIDPPSPFRLRFVARDLGAGSLVEAAIDDLSIDGLACAPVAADLNLDGQVDGDDLGSLLGQWGPCPGCGADLDGDGVVDGDDLGTLLGEWSLPR